MGKNNWLIVKRHDNGEYYPAINHTDINWDFEKQCFVNSNNGSVIDIIHDLGKVTDKQQEMFWQGFLLGMKSKEREAKNITDEKNSVEILTEHEKSTSFILKEVLELAKNELTDAGDSIGYTMPDGKYHLFIYVDEVDEKLYVIEPNRVEDGAHEPFTGDTYGAKYGDFEELMAGCMWAMERFEEDKLLMRDATQKGQITLKDFLMQFDFSYEIVMADEPGERTLRENLFEEGYICEDNLDLPMFRLKDLQGANLGGIEGERYSIIESLAETLIERLDSYINDYVICEFEEALGKRNIDASSMNLKEMVEKARELCVPEHGEVSYELAECILNPELIDITDVLKDVSYKRENSLGEEVIKTIYNTTEEITKKFIADGWNNNTSFSELTLEEAREKGYLWATKGIPKGCKYFKMNVSGNIYDNRGKLVFLNLNHEKTDVSLEEKISGAKKEVNHQSTISQNKLSEKEGR